MLTVEECLEKLKRICDKPKVLGQVTYEIKDNWDRQFIFDVVRRTYEGNAISTSQGEIVLRLVSRYKPHLHAVGLQIGDLDSVIQTPKYRKPPYQSAPLPREVRWAGDNKLVFRCKYNQNIVNDLKKCKGNNPFEERNPVFDHDNKLWIVDVNSGNWKSVMDVIKRYKFDFDDEVAQFFMEVSNAENQLSEAKVEDGRILVTVKDDSLLDSWLNCIKAMEG
jgi:hypothetical protein